MCHIWVIIISVQLGWKVWTVKHKTPASGYSGIGITLGSRQGHSGNGEKWMLM